MPSESHLSDVWFQVTGLEVVSGRGASSRPPTASEYLDFTSGIAVTSTGHCHPQVVAAIQEQAGRFIHAQVNCYRHALLEPLATRLAEITPAGIDTFFFANSGAEATEAAVKLAKQVTGRPNVIVFRRLLPRSHAPHDGDDDVEDRLPRRSPAVAERRVRRSVPDPLGGADRGRGGRTRSPGSTTCSPTQTAPDETAAVVIEPVLGEGGYAPGAGRVPPAVSSSAARAHGILFVADEVQTGFGRTGHDVRGRARRRRARRRRAWPRASPPASRSRRIGTSARARRTLAAGRARRHLRRQPDRLCGGAGDHRRARPRPASSTA